MKPPDDWVEVYYPDLTLRVAVVRSARGILRRPRGRADWPRLALWAAYELTLILGGAWTVLALTPLGWVPTMIGSVLFGWDFVGPAITGRRV